MSILENRCLTLVNVYATVYDMDTTKMLPRVRHLSPVARRLQLRKAGAAESSRLRYDLTMQMVRA